MIFFSNDQKNELDSDLHDENKFDILLTNRWLETMALSVDFLIIFICGVGGLRLGGYTERFSNDFPKMFSLFAVFENQWQARKIGVSSCQ